jgi:hypothetical protein
MVKKNFRAVRFGLILAGTVPAAAWLYKIQLCSRQDQFLRSIPCYPNMPLVSSLPKSDQISTSFHVVA